MDVHVTSSYPVAAKSLLTESTTQYGKLVQRSTRLCVACPLHSVSSGMGMHLMVGRAPWNAAVQTWVRLRYTMHQSLESEWILTSPDKRIRTRWSITGRWAVQWILMHLLRPKGRQPGQVPDLSLRGEGPKRASVASKGRAWRTMDTQKLLKMCS